jgi:hypothetical protein
VITFTAANDTIFEQSESFSVTISAPVNATLGTTAATGTILDDVPVDPNDINTVTKDTTLSVAANAGLLVGATDSQGDTLTITSYTVAGIAGTPTIGSPFAIPGVGALTINSDGSYIFVPAANYTGPIPVVTYTISDGISGADTSTLTLTMNKVDDVEVTSMVSRLIPTAPNMQKPFEHPPLKMGYYEFNTVVLDFNGAYGGINQFSLPHGETTLRRGALQYSNHTPYVEFDRVGDELQNAQRTINTNAILSPPSNDMLPNSVLPPDEQLDSSDTEISIPPPSTLVGGKGDQKFTAYAKNGKPLPDWIKFNRVNGNFEIFSSDEAMEPVEIQVIGTDTKGNQAETKPNNKPPVKPVPKTAFVGKESLTSQIKSALTFGKG